MITSEHIHALRRLFKTQQQFADKVGVSQATVSRWLSGVTPEPEYQQKLMSLAAELMETQPETHYNPPKTVFPGDRTLPVYAAAEGGAGEIVVSTDPIEMVPRPWYLGEVKDAYAVVIVGESMVPKFRPGDMAIANPKEPVLRDKDYLFIQENHAGEFIGTVKRLIGMTATEWKVEQYNPPKTFTLPRDVWGRAVRIVGSFDRG